MEALGFCPPASRLLVLCSHPRAHTLGLCSFLPFPIQKLHSHHVSPLPSPRTTLTSELLEDFARNTAAVPFFWLQKGTLTVVKELSNMPKLPCGLDLILILFITMRWKCQDKRSLISPNLVTRNTQTLCSVVQYQISLPPLLGR